VEPIVVEVTRGEVVEARHVVHAVAVRDGRVELSAGDATLVTYLRSSAKPIQALPVVRARPDLDDEEIALACASHLAAPEQLAVVRRLLSDAPAVEDELECGGAPTPIEHNCSGKHAGFLALCRARDWPTPGYRMLERQRERAAHCFARLASLEGGESVVRAMRAHPDLLRGPVATDALMIRALDGWVAKGGAEGLYCAASADGLGLALKVLDGAFRAIQPALAHMLAVLGIDPGPLGASPVSNSLGEQVGELRVRFEV